MESKKIQLKDIRPPDRTDGDADIEWLCKSLNLFTKKDSERSAYRVLRILIRSSLEGEPKTSSEIADELDLTRGAVLFHLKKFSRCGLVSQAGGRRYILPQNSLEDTIDDMMRDSQRIFDNMRRIAAEIDQELGVKKRW